MVDTLKKVTPFGDQFIVTPPFSILSHIQNTPQFKSMHFNLLCSIKSFFTKSGAD